MRTSRGASRPTRTPDLPSRRARSTAWDRTPSAISSSCSRRLSRPRGRSSHATLPISGTDAKGRRLSPPPNASALAPDPPAQLAVAADQVRQLGVGGQSARVRQHPRRTVADRLRLKAEAGVRPPEARPPGGETDDGHDPRLVL